ncbi:MAG TPA: chemotaxis protein CheW [Luteimonas sp.]|nr:chemotaxis protein CheW [Luteimonas sp.]
MTTTGNVDVVDDYIDALLEDAAAVAPASTAATPHDEPASSAASVPVPAAAPAQPSARNALPAAAPAIAMAAAPAAAPPEATAGLPAAAQPRRWVRVAVGGDSYALELLCVQEVVRLAPIVAMRGAARAVLGVMNLRGRIVPVFDLGLWLGLECVQRDERNRIVVVERDDELIGVLVSAVDDVVTLGRDRIEPPLPGADPGPTLGVARVGAMPTVLLDANALYG